MDRPKTPQVRSRVARDTGPFVGAAEASRTGYTNRLAGRHDVMPALNRLVALAARLMGAASGQVSLLGDVQTVMAGIGDAEQSVGVESPAESSLCTVTLEANTAVAVTDAPRDPRVRDLPPVTSGTVGAYLGVPLVVGGHTVGALCVFDRTSREWSADDISLLEQLSGPVCAELELAALEASYDEDRLLWQLAIDSAGVGVWDWDLSTRKLRWDDRLLDLFGLDRSTFGGTIEAFNATVHPEDLGRVSAALDEAVRTVGSYAAEYRVRLPDGGVRWIAARGQAFAGPDGGSARVIGAAYDTTATVDAEARVARVLEAMPAAFYHLDEDWRFAYANATAERLLGGIGAPLVGREIWELFPATVGSDFEHSYRRAVETRCPVEFVAYYPAPLDGFYEVRAWPTDGGLSVYFSDVTERRASQDALALVARRDALLAEVTFELSETEDVEEAVARLAQLVVPELGDWCVASLAAGNGSDSGTRWQRRVRDIGSWHRDADRRAVVARYAELRVGSLTDDAFHAQALDGDTGPMLHTGLSEDTIADMLAPGEARDLLVGLRPSASVVVPLRGRGRTVGLLTVVRGADRAPFAESDLVTLAQIASRAGLALGNARSLGEHRELAEVLQRSLLTDPPEPDHLEVAVRYEPAATAAQVGGDWYDAFVQPGGTTTIVIGDVMGHDTVAAAAMGQLRSLLRGIAVTTDEGPAAVLRRLDEAMEVLEIDTAATAVLARLEQTAQERGAGVTRLRWSNAGHPPPLLAVPGEAGLVEVRALWPEAPEVMLGYESTAERTESVLTVPRGSTVILYTDGLIERRGEPIDQSVEQLRALVAELVADGLVLDDLCSELLTRMRPPGHEDDVALVAVRLHPEDRPRPPEAGPGHVPPVLS